MTKALSLLRASIEPVLALSAAMAGICLGSLYRFLG
jgi:hypothetical protein